MSIYSFLTELAIPAAWQDAIAALLILFVAWLVGMILSWALGKAGHYFAQKAKSELGDQVILSLRSPLFLLCLLVGAYLAADELSLPSRLFRSIEGIIYALGVFLGALVLKRIFDAFIGRIAGQVAKRTGSRLYGEFSPLLDKVATFFIFGIALIIVLARLGYSVTSLVAALGAGSLAIALAAKETLSNMISGFIIMTDRPFLPGDRIQLASQEEGEVLEIGLRSTRLKTPEGSFMVIPNSQLVDSRVVNQSYPDARMSCAIRVPVPFGKDVALVTKILEETPQEVPDVLDDPLPRAFIEALNQETCEFLLTFWIRDSRKKREAVDQVYRRIWERFQRESIWSESKSEVKGKKKT